MSSMSHTHGDVDLPVETANLQGIQLNIKFSYGHQPKRKQPRKATVSNRSPKDSFMLIVLFDIQPQTDPEQIGLAPFSSILDLSKRS